jgi:hypothetical protein
VDVCNITNFSMSIQGTLGIRTFYYWRWEGRVRKNGRI